MVATTEGSSAEADDHVVVVVLPQGQDGEYSTETEGVKLETVNREQVQELLDSGAGVIAGKMKFGILHVFIDSPPQEFHKSATMPLFLVDADTVAQVTEEVTMIENDPDWTPEGQTMEIDGNTVQIETHGKIIIFS